MDIFVKLDTTNQFIEDFQVKPKDEFAMMQFVNLADEVLDLKRIQGYEIFYQNTVPYIRFSETKWNEYLALVEEKKNKAQCQEIFEELSGHYALEMATDAQAYSMRYLYPKWTEGEHYKQGERLMYKDIFYKTLQPVEGAQKEHAPDVAVSLYVEIPDPSIEWPEWKQPTGAHDAYSKGAKVSYKGNHYISNIEANTTEPGTDDRYWIHA